MVGHALASNPHQLRISEAHDIKVLPMHPAKNFWYFCGTTFISFLTVSMLSMLAIILSDAGYNTEQTGLILSVPLVPTLLGMLLSGITCERFGVLASIRGGIFLMVSGYIALAACITNYEMLLLIRVLYGVGHGIFVPSAMLLAKRMLPAEGSVYYFGIYAGMLPTPNIIGPWIAETLYATQSLTSYFVLTGCPLLLGCMGMFFLVHEPVQASIAKYTGSTYRSVAATPAAYIPLVSVFCVGFIFGFIPSYMALFLQQQGVAIALFFTSFTITLVICRFYLLRFVERVERNMLIFSGFLLMACGYACAAYGNSPAMFIIAGILFGTGNSVAYPNLSTTLAACFAEDRRSKPVALFNMVFFAGIYLSPLAGGYIMGQMSLLVFLQATYALSAACAALYLIMAVRVKKRQQHATP